MRAKELEGIKECGCVFLSKRRQKFHDYSEVAYKRFSAGLLLIVDIADFWSVIVEIGLRIYPSGG